jgi:hypothetical protein
VAGGHNQREILDCASAGHALAIKDQPPTDGFKTNHRRGAEKTSSVTSLTFNTERDVPELVRATGARGLPLHGAVIGETRRPFMILAGAVGFVLLNGRFSSPFTRFGPSASGESSISLAGRDNSRLPPPQLVSFCSHQGKANYYL